MDSSIINPVCLVWMISPKIRTFWEFNFLNTFSKVSNIALLSHAIFVSSDLWYESMRLPQKLLDFVTFAIH